MALPNIHAPKSVVSSPRAPSRARRRSGGRGIPRERLCELRCARDPALRVKNGSGQDDSHEEQNRRRARLVRGFVIAGFAAVVAVHQAVVANADIHHGLAKTAELFAITRTFGLVALSAAIFGRTGSGAHESNVARCCRGRKMTLVIAAWADRICSGHARFLRAL
jgi:hypothetical protein